MKQVDHGFVVRVIPIACCMSCGPHVGGLTVEQWVPLAQGSWSLEPGTSDSGWCSTITLPEDTYIAALRPMASPGTHHIALSVASQEDNDCAAGNLSPATLYVAGPGGAEVRMPSGVAMRLREGQSIHLKLHVYNATATRLDGVAGVEMIRAKPNSVRSEAAFVLAGPETIKLPPKQRTTVTQTCWFTGDQTAIALVPLMHKLGVWFKSVIASGGESTVLYDGAFRFDDQFQLSFDGLTARAGDSITTECTYENTKYVWISNGHADGEMCYSALLRFPSGAQIDCTAADTLRQFVEPAAGRASLDASP